MTWKLLLTLDISLHRKAASSPLQTYSTQAHNNPYTESCWLQQYKNEWGTQRITIADSEPTQHTWHGSLERGQRGSRSTKHIEQLWLVYNWYLCCWLCKLCLETCGKNRLLLNRALSACFKLWNPVSRWCCTCTLIATTKSPMHQKHYQQPPSCCR